MAGRPKTRARREAAERAGARPPKNGRRAPAERSAIIARAAEVGDATAAREHGVADSTIRAWRTRAKAKPKAIDTAGSDVDRLLAEAQDHRERAARAAKRSDELVQRGEGHQAKALMQVAQTASATANDLAAAAHEQAEHEARGKLAETALAEEQVALFQRAVQVVIESLDLPWTAAMVNLTWAAVRALAEGERDAEHPDQMARIRIERPAAEAQVALADVERHRRGERIRPDYGRPPPGSHDELIAEVDAELAEELRTAEGERQAAREHEAQSAGFPSDPARDTPPPLQPPKPASPKTATPADDASPKPPERPDDELPRWEELPAEWKRKFAMNPGLGRWEYAQSLKREKRRGAEMANGLTGSSRFAMHRHPGWGSAA